MSEPAVPTTSTGSTIEPAGRKLLRLEVRNSQVPIERKPEWIKTRLKTGPEYTELKSLVRREGLHTVCEEAGCPNIYECWEDREATFLIGGDQCTRRCDFCQIDTGKPADFDAGEPLRVAESVQKMQLRYATVTGVCRDDLADEGAWLYAETIREVHRLNPDTGVEMLAPDFTGDLDLLGQLFAAEPEVFAHNIETVPRIFRRIRPGFRYERSLEVLRASRSAGLVTKSNLILGMGETRPEISAAMRDLHDAGNEILTITQYLRPSPRHHPVDRWVRPEEFVELAEAAREAKKAEKAPKRASNAPADMGRMRKIKRAYQVTQEHDRALPYLLLAAFLLPLAAAIVIGLLTDQVLNLIFVGLGVAILLPMIVLVRRAKAATYKRYAGQAGSAEVALSMLPKKWISAPVIAANRSQDVVHRTLGPGGLVLIGEGEPGRVKTLLAGEVKKHERVAYGIPVTTVVMGNKSGQVPLDKLADHIRKLPKTLQANQVTDIKQRLRALDAVRPSIPVPKGPMPTNPRQVKGARQAMRGR